MSEDRADGDDAPLLDLDSAANPGPTQIERIDGRSLRRERNVAAVVDAVLEMFQDESLTPTIEGAADRSGLSLRSVYRYFPDPESLTQAAIDELWRRSEAIAHLSSIGQGPFEERVQTFAEMRVRFYEHVRPAFRAARLHAPRSVSIRDDLERTRRVMSDQFALQFRVEIDALPSEVRTSRRSMADVMSQFEVIDQLRRSRSLTVPESIEVVADAIRLALSP